MLHLCCGGACCNAHLLHCAPLPRLSSMFSLVLHTSELSLVLHSCVLHSCGSGAETGPRAKTFNGYGIWARGAEGGGFLAFKLCRKRSRRRAAGLVWLMV